MFDNICFLKNNCCITNVLLLYSYVDVQNQNGGHTSLYSLLLNIFWWIVVLNLFALAVLVIFFCNARINLKRQIDNKRFLIKFLNSAKNSKTTAEAAVFMGISLDDYLSFCKERGIDTPDQRRELIEKVQKKKADDERKIREEEATWRAEQDTLNEDRRKAIEEETQKRKERLKKFGFR